MKFATKIIVSSLILFATIAPLVVPRSAAALVGSSSKDAACKGIALGNSTGCDSSSTTGLSNTIKSAINILSIIVGTAAVIMVMIGGFRYVTSGGDSNAVSGAKNTIIYALIGLVVAALAQILVRFVLNKI